MTGLLAHSDHDNFAVVGMAVPDRIKLFRAQMGRAVGANSRRTSVSSLIHNDLRAVAVSSTLAKTTWPSARLHSWPTDFC